MAAHQACELSYDVLLGMVPVVMDLLDLDSEDVFASGILDDDRLDDAAVAMILSHDKCKKERTDTASNNTQVCDLTSVNDDDPSNSKVDQLQATSQDVLLNGLPSDSLNTVQMDSFRIHFRMNEIVYNALLQDLMMLTSFAKRRMENEGTASDQDGAAPFPMPSDTMLKLTLQFLGCQHPMDQLAAAANTPEMLYSCVVHETIDALYELLQHYIIWPESHQVADINEQFRQKCGLQGVLGIIDVVHVPVKVPAEHTDYYTNQHSETTVVLQTVCDHRLRFLHCCTGWPGSMDEETVLKDSDLHNDVQNQIDTYFPLDSYLVGDEAYRLTSWLMTPFADDGNLNALQQQFNSACHLILQNSTQAYTLLMQRFPRLECVEMKDMQSMVVTVLVCCALHNFCLDSDDQEVCEDA